MRNHITANRKRITSLLMVIALSVIYASCTGNNPDDNGNDDGTGSTGADCTKCIDNKPPATPFSTTLNAIDHSISLNTAVQMVNNYENARGNMLSANYSGSDVLPIHETFNLKAIDSLICQENTIGLRIYMSMDEGDKIRFVLVGVDGDGMDVIQRRLVDPMFTADAVEDISVYVVEAGQRWP